MCKSRGQVILQVLLVFGCFLSSVIGHGTEKVQYAGVADAGKSFNPQNYKVIEEIYRKSTLSVDLLKHRWREEFVIRKTYSEPEISNVIEGSPSERLKDRRRRFLHGLELAESIRYPGFVSIFYVDKGDPIVVYMEYLPGGELETALNKSIELHAREFTRGVIFTKFELEWKILLRNLLEVLSVLEGEGLVHSDVKGANCMFRKKGGTDTVLIDPDYIHNARREDCRFCGTHHYIAPEIHHKDAKHMNQTKRDVWSAGVLLHMLATGVLPFNELDDRCRMYGCMRHNCRMLAHRVNDEKYTAALVDPKIRPIAFVDEKFTFLPELFKDFLSHLLEKNPEKRWTATQTLAHPWLQIPPYDPPTEGFMLPLVLPAQFVEGVESPCLRVTPETTIDQCMEAIMLKFHIRKSAQRLFRYYPATSTENETVLSNPRKWVSHFNLTEVTPLHVGIL